MSLVSLRPNLEHAALRASHRLFSLYGGYWGLVALLGALALDWLFPPRPGQFEIVVGYWGLVAFAASLALQYLFPQKIEGPRADPESLKVSTARYGDLLARVHGRGKVAGRGMWLEGNKITEHVSTQREGGLFGVIGGAIVTTYRYTSSFAIGLTDHEIQAVPRIWSDDKLVLDITEEAFDNIASGQLVGASGGLQFKLYRGTDDQVPDPRLVADVGEEAAEAYTGTSVLFIYDWDHTANDTGIRLPNVEAEVVTEADFVYPTEEFEVPAGVRNGSLVGGDADYDPELHIGLWLPETEGWLVAWRAQDQGLLYAVDLATRDGITSAWRAVCSDGLGHVFFIGAGNIYAYDIYTGAQLQVFSAGFSTLNGLGHVAIGRVTTTGDRFLYFYHQNTDSFIIHVNALTGVMLGIPGSWGASNATSQINCMTADANNRVWLFGNSSSAIPRIHEVGPAAGIGAAPTTTHDMSGVGLGFSGAIGAGAYIETDNTLIVHATYGGTKRLVKLDADDPTTVIAYLDASGSGNAKSTWSRRGWTKEPTLLWVDSSVGGSIKLIDPPTLSVIESILHTEYAGDSSIWSDFEFDPVLRAYAGWNYSGDATKSIVFLPRVPDGRIPRAQIIRDECRSVGIEPDVSGVSGDEVGYVVRDDSPPRTAIEDIMRVRAIEACQLEGALTFFDKRTASERTISAEHVGAEQGGDPGESLVVEQPGDPFDLPPGVVLNYIAYEAQYRAGSQRMGMPDGFEAEKGDLTFGSNLVMLADDAAQAADVILQEARDIRKAFTTKLPPRELDQHPGGVVTLPLDDGRTVGVVMTEMRQDLIIEAQYHRRVFDYTSAAVGEPTPDTIPVPINLAPSRFQPLDIPIVADTDDDEAFYYLVYPVGFGSFESSTVYRSLDGGNSWNEYGASGTPGIVGAALGALADHRPWRTDRTNTVDVAFPSSPGETVTHAAARNGANLFAVQAGQEWELVNVVTITDLGNNIYGFSDIIRGRDGSDSLTANHAGGDLVVKLDDAVIRSLDTTSKDVDSLFVAATSGIPPSGFGVEFTNEALGNRPRAPYPVHLTRDGDDVDVDWRPTTRLMHGWLSGDASFGAGEATEEYEVDISEGTTLLRTVAGLSSPTTTYTLAQYQSDVGGSPAPGAIPDGIEVRVFKISTTFGRGLPGIAIL